MQSSSVFPSQGDQAGRDLTFEFISSLNPLITKFSPKNTVCNPTISLFGCHEAKFCSKSHFLVKRKIFRRLDTTLCNISLRCMCINQNYITCMFSITCSQLFFLPFSFPFSRPFYSRYLFSLHILSGCCKKLGVNYGQCLEMDLDQL